MKKIFLDCGSNLGQGFEEFKEIYGIIDIAYHLFEPNINCYRKLAEKYSSVEYIKIFNKAIGAQTSQISFYYKKDFDVGGSIITDHNSKFYNLDQQKKINVECIDFDLYVKTQKEFFEKIYVKLDIECAEYDVLEKLISTQNIFLIDKFYIEFHSQYMKEDTKLSYEIRERNIINFMTEHKINFELWK